MFWGIIHRMILIELVKVFIMALIALTGIILLAGIISEAMKNGFGPAQILAIIPLLLPSLIPYTVPTTTLFATCIVYGRLSADNEIIALKAAGTHIVHVIWPAALLGIVTAAITMAMFFDVIPYTGYLLRNRVISDVEELLYMMLRRDGHIKHPRLSVEIDVSNVVGRRLQEAIFKRRSADGKTFDVIAYAKEAELRVDTAHKQILIEMWQCNIVQRDGGVAFVENKIWPVDLPPDFIGSSVKFRGMDMTWTELSEYYDKAVMEKNQVDERVRLQMIQSSLNPNANNQNALPPWRTSSATATSKSAPSKPNGACGRRWRSAAFASRWSAARSASGSARAITPSAFITCFLPIVIIYYPLMFCMYDMSRAGKIPPWLGIFNADLMMLIAGAILFRRLARN